MKFKVGDSVRCRDDDESLEAIRCIGASYVTDKLFVIEDRADDYWLLSNGLIYPGKTLRPCRRKVFEETVS